MLDTLLISQARRCKPSFEKKNLTIAENVLTANWYFIDIKKR
jgi:hypothetical protein